MCASKPNAINKRGAKMTDPKTSSIPLSEIVQIKQTCDDFTVNDYLKKGFRILRIFSGKVSGNGVESVMPVYVLGLKE